jgi:hypothetical protein
MATLSACAPRLTPLTADGLSVTRIWDDNRDRYRAISALADVAVDAGGADLPWPEFTAVFAYHAPDRVAVTGFNPLGTILFTYEAGDGRYTLRGPDPERARTGKLGARGANPEARMLGALVHLVDGVLGPETGDGKVGVTPDGRWEVRRHGETVDLAVDGARVEAVEVRRRAAGAVALDFGDWREVGPLEAPHRIRITLASSRLSAEIRVQEWRLEDAPDTAAGPAPALTATRNSPYLEEPDRSPLAGRMSALRRT